MTSIPERQASVNPQITVGTIPDEAVQTLRQTIGARISTFLVKAADNAIGLSHYVRRKRISERRYGEAQPSLWVQPEPHFQPQLLSSSAASIHDVG